MTSIENQKNFESEKSSEEYWLKKLSGDLIRNSFHYDSMENVPNVRIVDSQEFRFFGDIFSKLSNFCGESNEKLFEFLVSGLVALLYRHSYTGSKDIIVGSPVCNENSETKSRNTILPLRIQILDNITFDDLLKTTSDTIIEASKYRDYPIEELPKKLNIHVYGDDFPFFDVALSVENIHDKRHLRHINVNMIFSFYRTTKYIEGVVEYNASLYSKSTIKRIISHFTNLIREALMQLEGKISDINILSDEETRELLYELNDTKADYPTDKTIPGLLQDEVEKNPWKIALVFEDRNFSYSELNKRANRLGRILRENGVLPDGIVAVFLDRSIEFVVAIMGILKAGAAYLPIVVDTPEDRIRSVLNDSAVKLMMSNGYFGGKVAFEGKIIDVEDKSLYYGENTNLDIVSYPDCLIYVIYTSGSTGKPKGVMLEQRNFINLLYFEYRETNVDYSGRVLQFASVGFDVSAQEIFSTLLACGTLYLNSTETKHDAPRLLEYIGKNFVSILFMPPAYLKFIFSDSGMAEKVPKCIKHIIAAGEQLIVPPGFKKFLKENKVFLHNHYGPTESHVITALTLDPDGEIPEAPSIGKSITNNRIMILGRDNKNLQPLGIPGELYISGVNVARGYSNRPELTDERFLFNPLVTGERMYRTGDLSRWLPDGNIEYMGRIDFQIKIRGFRIEIGEIESQIMSQQDQPIKEVVVIPKEDSSGEKYLCAYIVSETKVDISRLSSVLSKNLPDYMIPAYFMQIEKIPLNVNGKVDRKALPDPKAKERGENYVAPRNEIEKQLVEIWAEILRIKKDILSIDDDFFKMGGHSLKAAVMIANIHKKMNFKVLMHEVFEMPTIRALSEYLMKGAKTENYFSIDVAEEKEYYPQSSAQKRLFFIDQLEKNSTAYNIQMMDVYCKGFEKKKLHDVFKKLIKRHESFRTSFFLLNGEAVQKVHDYDSLEGNFEIEYYETREDGLMYSSQEGKEWTQITGLPFHDVLEHFVRPFDLTRPPLVRCALIKIWGLTQIFMVDMHHIMSDGVSEVILIKEIWDLYDSGELESLPIQYKDYAVWTSSDEFLAEVKKQETYWLNDFSGEIVPLNLPYDFSRPARQSFDGDTVQFEIFRDETQKLNMLAQDQGVTLYMVLIAIYNVMLAKLSGQEEVIIGTVSAGRGHADLQNIIGMFVNTLIIRNYPASGKSFSKFLGEVKKKTLRAFENQDYPFEQLVSNVVPNHDRNRNPLFDVAFTYESEADRTEAYLLDVLMLDKSSPYQLNVKKSKFDMMFTAAETMDGLQFIIEYATSLFKIETIERFIKYFKKIINSLCEDSIEQTIAEIEIISLEEKMGIIYIFNDSAAVYPKDKLIHELFETRVEKTPNNIALSSCGITMTYKDVNDRANQLARVLRNKGINVDNIVGIMTERSPEMIIGIMGILKAGGAYLPLDPGYPEDRIRYLFKDSACRLLLTQEKYVELADRFHFEGEMINLEDKSIYSGDNKNLKKVNAQKNLAYIIYTSGSTGKPKGVMIEHISAVNLLLALSKKYPLDESDVYLLKTAFLFDVSVSEIFGWFWRGGSLSILEPGGEKDPLMIINKIEAEKVTHINFVPSLFNAFVSILDHLNIFKLRSLKYIFLAGEAIWPESVKRFRSLDSNVCIENLYGPTEATVYASKYSIVNWDGSGSIPIGVPMDNLKLYIISIRSDIKTKLQLQPIGIAGELTVSGIGLARGYLNQPLMSFEKFIDNPYAIAEGKDITFKKLYRTGDLTRWMPNGNIEYLGRIDHQVKVRGFRIELGEIEVQLSKLEEIKEGVVLALESEERKGDNYLCAYFVAGKEVDTALIKEKLSKELPSYMIPSYFVQVEKIPLNPSGKIDRKALPKPEAKASSEYAPPSNEIEEILIETWQEVLGIKKIGINDNFFEIGGDSIKTILASGKLFKRGLDVHVNEFFSRKTIRQISPFVKRVEQVSTQVGVPRDMERMSKAINEEYKKYLEKVHQEKWPELIAENDFQHILLTGATGYLGAFLAFELLRNTSATLYLPIRGSNQLESEERLKRRFNFYFGSDLFNAYKNRLHILQTDLRQDRLAIDGSRYDKLCELVDAVLHSAANVKHYGSYDEFFKDNVEITERMLEFSFKGKLKPFHFISTIDTGRGDVAGKDFLVFTEYVHDSGQKSDNVYLRSKLEAEKKVLEYRNKGLNASIYRAGNLTFHSGTGRFQENIHDNYFYSMLKAFIKVGFWSEKMMKLEFDLSFIDYASKAIISLLVKKELKNQTYHISNPNILSWKDMGKLLRESGIEVKEEIERDLTKYEGNSEYEKIIERVKIYSWEWEDSGGTITIPKVNRSAELLKMIGFEWPKLNKNHIEKMIAHCKEVGFI